MMSPSERAIALFLSRTSSSRNRAILYLGITDGNVDDAIALFNSKPDESFRTALLRSAVQFRRPLANGAKGYEDKYGVLHLDTSTEDENDDDDENILCDAGTALKIGEEKVVRPSTRHLPARAAISERGEVLEVMNDFSPGGRLITESNKKRAPKNHRDRDSTFEPEEISAPLHQAIPTDYDKLPQRRHRGHRGRYARELKLLGSGALETADDGKPISARTRRSTSFKRVASLPKKIQCSRPRPTYSSPKKRVYEAITPPSTPRTRNTMAKTPATPTRCSTLLQSSEEYGPYLTPQETTQSRFKQAKKNTSGVANLGTPLSSGMASYPTPVSISSRPKTGSSIGFNTSDSQHQSQEILPSTFHRSSFESMSPLAMRSSKCKTYHHQRDESEIPLQDLYLAPISPISTFSFHSAMNLAREKKKWLLINIQSDTVPACGVLNREIWRHPDIASIVRQSFLFLQIDQNDERVERYLGTYYGDFDLDEEGEEMVCAGNNRKFVRLPHIALLDPVSGHRWEVWDGPALPDKDLFLADLCEYEMVGEGGWCEGGKELLERGTEPA